MHSAVGILTSTGGMTSHAAVVARGLGQVLRCGRGRLSIDAGKGTVIVNGSEVHGANDFLSIDGSTGEVMQGRSTASPPRSPETSPS
jgi:pyruvate,orthophosphate dikinase